MKTHELEVYIQQWFHEEHETKFMYILTILMWSEMSLSTHLSAGLLRNF